MKVTKQVEQYISKKIEAKFADELNELNRERQAITDKFDKAKEKASEAALAIIKDEMDMSMDECYVDMNIRARRGYSWFNPADEIDKKFAEIRGRINEITEDIIVNISLGGTKADLDTMIQEAQLV